MVMRFMPRSNGESPFLEFSGCHGSTRPTPPELWGPTEKDNPPDFYLREAAEGQRLYICLVADGMLREARTGIRLREFNPNHEPAGSPKGGEFARGQGAPMSRDQLRSEIRGLVDRLDTTLGRTLDTSVYVEGSAQSLEVAATVESVLTEMKAKGYEMPEKVIVNLDSQSSAHGSVARRPPRLERTLTITTPASLPADVTVDEAIRAAFSGRDREGVEWHTTKSLRDMVIHEMGHVQDHNLDRSADLMDVPEPFGPGPWTSTQLRAAVNSVSRYARTSRQEFRAEAFTRLYRGEKLTPDAQKLYDRLKGPKIR